MSEFGRLKAASSGDVDTLFSMVEKKPYSHGSVIGEDTTVPLGLANVAQDIKLPQYLQFAQAGGVVNGNFNEGPPDGDGSVLDNTFNRLPGWTIDPDSSSNIQFEYHVDSGTSYVRAVALSGVSLGDEASIWTEFPVTQIGRILRPRTALDVGAAALAGTTTEVCAKLTFDFRKLDGTVVTDSSKTSTTDTNFPTDGSSLDQWRTPKWGLDGKEAYARLTLVARATGSGTGTIASFSDVWAGTPATYDVALPFRRTYDPGTSDAFAIGIIDDTTHRYHATMDGFVMGLSGTTSDTILDGTANVYAREVTSDTSLPVLGSGSGVRQLDTDSSSIESERLLERSWDYTVGGTTYPYDFRAGDEIRLHVETNGSYAGPSMDWLFVLRLLLVFGDNTSPFTSER